MTNKFHIWSDGRLIGLMLMPLVFVVVVVIVFTRSLLPSSDRSIDGRLRVCASPDSTVQLKEHQLSAIYITSTKKDVRAIFCPKILKTVGFGVRTPFTMYLINFSNS